MRRSTVVASAMAAATAVGLVAAAAVLTPRVPSRDGGGPPDDAAPRSGVVRVRVAGMDGHFVVFSPDGTSFLETPSGRRELVDAGFAARRRPEAVAAKVAETLAASPRRQPGQLVVLDGGVVDIPVGAQITLMESDRLVTMNGDGTATVYHVDGRVEVRDRRKNKPGG